MIFSSISPDLCTFVKCLYLYQMALTHMVCINNVFQLHSNLYLRDILIRGWMLSDQWTFSHNMSYITHVQEFLMKAIGGGGGGVERDQISDIRHPKKIKYQISDPPTNQISHITRSQKSEDIWLKKIRYQISDPQKNQLSDITPPKNQISDIKVPPFHPPPPPPR